MQRVKLKLACLVCLSWVSTACAQTALEYDPGVATIQEYSGSATFSGTYFDIRYMSGDGVGYRNGYTQIGATLPIWATDDMLIAPSARVIVTDTKQVGANGGVLLRGYSDDSDRIYGGYLMFDYDESIDGFNYRQFGLGLESLGERYDIRANAYLPTDSGDNFVRALSLSSEASFLGNNIVFLSQGLFQEALTGGDIEFGGPLSPNAPWLRGFLGAYFYDAVQEDPVGVRGRLEAWVSDDLSVAVNVTEDQNFGTNVNAVIDWRFSGWKPTRYFPQWSTRERMLMPIQRNWRIATSYYTDTVAVLGENCDTGDPFFVVWVDNSNAGPGTGTFEDPFTSLPASAPGADLILVRKGDTTFFDPLVGSITLSDGQRLLGEGCEHFVEICATFGGLTQTATIALPGFENTGDFPTLSSPGNIITLADGNEVSGFNLVNAGGFAITNTPAGSLDFDLSCLNITNNAGGIFLSNASGNGNITDVTMVNNAAGGLYLDTGATDLFLSITNVTANSLPAGTQGVGLSLNADDGGMVAVLNDVTASGNGTGIVFSADGALLQTFLDNVTVAGSVGNGIQVNGSFSNIFMDIQNTQVIANGGTGMQVVADNTYFTLDADNVVFNGNGLDNLNILLSNSTMQVEIDNASFSNSTAGSGIVITNSAGGGIIDLDNVIANNNALDGLLIAATTFAQVDAIVNASLFNNNGLNGIELFTNTGGVINFQDPGVVATGNGQDGFHFEAHNDGVIFADILGANFANNARSAVYGFLDNGSAFVTLTNTRGNESGADGMYIEARNDSVVSMTVNRGDFSDSGQTADPAAAIRIIADDSIVGLQVTNTPLNNTVIGFPQDDGLNIIAANFSTVVATITDSDMSGNADNAMELIADGNSQLQVDLLRSNGTDSGNDGILFQSLNNSLLVVTADQSNFDRSGMNGINGTLNNTSTAVFDFLASSVSNSGDNGLVVTADNGSAFIGSFEGGSFINSGQNLNGLGFQDANNLTAHNFSTIDVSLINTPSGNVPPNTTQQHSLFAVIDNGSSLFFSNSGGDMSNNTIDAINVSLAGGSFGQIDLLNTLASNSGFDGYIFSVDASTLFSTVVNGSFENSGSSGVAGSAVNGLITNGGFAQLSFTNTPSDGAFDHGLAIAALGGSTFIGQFDASSFDFAGSLAGVPSTPGNAVLLVANASTIDLTMINGSTGDFAGGDGLVIDAANGSSVTATIIDGSFSDAGQFTGFGAGVNVTADASFVAVNLINTPTSNSAGNTTQAFGLLFNVTGGSDFFYGNTNGTVSGNTLNGISGSADGAGTAATLTLSGTLVDINGFEGALFNITGGATLNFNIPGGGSISNNGGSGVFATVDGAGTVANFNFVDVIIDGNGTFFGGDGFNANPTNGAIVNASFIGTTPGSSSISGNNNRGVNIFLDNGIANYFFDNTTVDNNGNEGLLFDVSGAASQLVVTAINGTSFANNGTAGVPPAGFDNVNGQVTGGFIDLLFDDVNADNSTRSGFNFDISDATGPTSFTVQMNNGTSASNNANGNGVRMVSTGPTTAAHLLMVGANLFNDNGTAAPVLPAPGLPGSGVYFEADNVLQAAVRFAGSASNNGNAANPDPSTDQDGVTINIDTATFAAVEVNGPGSISNNVQDGVDIELTNVTNIQDITLFTQTGFETVLAMGMNNVSVDDNGGDGVSYIVTGPTTFTGAIVFDGVFSGNNGGNGLLLSLTDVAGTPDLSILNGGFSGNTLNGVFLDLDNAPLDTVLIANNATGGGAAVGVEYNVFGEHWEIENLTPDPTVLIDQIVYDVGPTGLTFAVTRGPAGAEYEDIFGSAATGLQTINGFPLVPGFLQPGVITDGSTILTLVFNDFDNADFPYHFDAIVADLAATAIQTGNDLAGLIATATFSNGEVLQGVFDGNQLHTFIQAASAGGIGGNGLDGIHIEQIDSSFNQLIVDGNIIADNGDDGIDFAVVTNSNIVAPGEVAYFTNNTITGNGVVTGIAGDGVSLVNPGVIDTNLNLGFIGNTISDNGGVGVDIQLSAPITTATARFESNTINGNGAQGVNLIMNDGIALAADFVNNSSTISGNAAEGINIQLTTGGSFTGNEFYGNTISNNGSLGVRLEMALNTTAVWNLGALGQAANVIDGNTAAGVGINMSGGPTQLDLRVRNSTFSNTAIGADPDFDGDGLAINTVDQAVINLLVGEDVNATRNTFFTGNGDDGMSIVMNDDTQLVNAGFFNIGATGNGAASADGAGLRIDRFGMSVLDNALIAGSSFDTNDDGLALHAFETPNVDEYFMFDNSMSSNTNRGVDLRVEADAQILINMVGNTIASNGNQGIQMTESVNSNLDIRDISGLIHDNLINLNGNQGIEVSAMHGENGGLFILQNLITNNGQSAPATQGDGIEINRLSGLTGLGFSVIELNTITGNLGSGVNINAGDNTTILNIDFGGLTTSDILDNNISENGLKGIELTTDINDSLDVVVFGNTILDNLGDGIEIVNNGFALVQIGDSAGGAPVAANINTIADNGGRGVDILNREFGITDVRVLGNNILRNQQEGIYAINTPTGTQASDIAANVDLTTTTNYVANPILVLTADANQIRNNGFNSTYDTTGLVVRVGTSDAFAPYNSQIGDNGGFASFGDGGDGSFDLADSTFRGGVLANITNNQFSGQFGNDASFESFVGASDTAAVPYGLFFGTLGTVTATAGTWTDQNENPRNFANDAFDVNTFRQDPLARLDLNFEGNTGLSLDVTRQGAAYNNNEDVFKSRTQGQDNNTDGGIDDDGPFTSGTRRRNAQRVAARFVADFPPGGKLDPQLTIFGTGGTAGTSDDFLFPGMGTSTFRISGTTETLGFALGDTFFLDTAPFDQTTFDSNGDFFPGANIFGENPFGWSLVP